MTSEAKVRPAIAGRFLARLSAGGMQVRGMKAWMGFVVLMGVAAAVGRAAERRPNVLWIIAEDMSPHLSEYGVPELRTPNLDALARKGMRFDRAFVTGAVCSTSRSAFNTGMYQT